MHYRSLREIAKQIRSGQLSSVDVTEHTLQRIAEHDADLGSFSVVLADEARRTAALRDEQRERGEELGPLHGVPIAVKDLFHVTGTPAAAGTIALADEISSHDGTVVARLRKAGAVIIGKLKMSEGAFAAHHPELGTPKNPWGEHLWVGASSSGCAAAVASGLSYATLGSDTGGSIRFPSAATGLSGLKPTWGRISRAGSVEFCGTLDTVGAIARDAYDCALVHDVIAGEDPADPVTLGHTSTSMRLACDNALTLTAGTRIGLDQHFLSVCDELTRTAILRAAETFSSLGAQIVDVALPDVGAIVDDWTPACAVESSLVHEERFREFPEKYGSQMAALIGQGLAMSATDYSQIRTRRDEFAGRMRAAMVDVDAVLLQVTGLAGASAAYLDEIDVGPQWREKIMMATCPINSAGLPAMTFPGGLTDTGGPLGIQLVGNADSESVLIALAHAFQGVTSHHLQHPRAYA